MGLDESDDADANALTVSIQGLDPFNTANQLTRYPDILASNVRNSLMLVPVSLLRQCLLDDIVKVGVMREDDMSTNIEEETFLCHIGRG